MINAVSYPNLANASQKVAFKSNPIQNGQTETKKSMSTTTKALIGASALAATVVGGLLLHKHIQISKLNKLSEALDKELSNLSNRISDRFASRKDKFGKFFNNEILQQHIDEAMRLPREERLARLKEIDIVFNDRGMLTEMKRNPEFLSSLPQELQEVMKSGDQLKATKAYIEYCDNLFHKSKTAGRTVAESVENVFGKNSGIKPHTYDLTKESDRIATYANGNSSGFHDVTVTSENKIVDELNLKNNIGLHSNTGKLHLSKDKPIVIAKDMVDGKPVVTAIFPDSAKDSLDNFIPNGIRLLSPNANLTPAQRDLLSLQDVQGIDYSLFSKLTDNAESKVNFDAILSTIQTLAEKYRA